MRYFLCFACPPLAVLLCGKPATALLSVLLTLCGWAPGIIHALFVVSSHKADVRANRIIEATRSSAQIRIAAGVSVSAPRKRIVIQSRPRLRPFLHP